MAIGYEFKTWFEEACGVYATLVDRHRSGIPAQGKQSRKNCSMMIIWCTGEIFTFGLSASQEIAKEFPHIWNRKSYIVYPFMDVETIGHIPEKYILKYIEY